MNDRGIMIEFSSSSIGEVKNSLRVDEKFRESIKEYTSGMKWASKNSKRIVNGRDATARPVV